MSTLSEQLFCSGEVQTRVESWFSNNKLVLNHIKSQELILSTSDNVSKGNTVTLLGVTIELE